MVDSQSTSDTARPASWYAGRPDRVATLWVVAWLGTVVAGGVFGMIVGGPLGALFGPIFAAVFATPILPTIAILTWAFWLTRFAAVMAAVAGGLTGAVAVTLTFGPGDRPDQGYVLLAALIGAAGAGGAAWWTTREPEVPPGGVRDYPPRWRFTLGNMFLRFTIVTLLIAAWTWALKSSLQQADPTESSLAAEPQSQVTPTAIAEQAFEYRTGLKWPDGVSNLEINGTSRPFQEDTPFSLLFTVPPEVMSVWLESDPPWGADDWLAGRAGRGENLPFDSAIIAVLQGDGIWYAARDRGSLDGAWGSGDLLILEPATGTVRYFRWDD